MGKGSRAQPGAALDALLPREHGALLERIRRFGDLKGYLYFLALGGSLSRMGLIDPAGNDPA